MIDALATIRTTIDHDTIPVVQALLVSHFLSGKQQMTRQFGTQFSIQRGHGAPRDHQNMCRSLRGDISEAHATGILVNYLGRYVSRDNPLEKCRHS